MSHVNNKPIHKKTCHKAVGLFLFVSVFTVTNAQADSKQDQAELEAFYWQVFGDDKKPIHKPNKKPQKIKNPELVAFYNQVFGNNKKSKRKKLSTNIVSKTKKVNNLIAPIPGRIEKHEAKKHTKTGKLQHLIDNLNKADKLSLEIKSGVNGKKRPEDRYRKKDPELLAFYEYVFGKNKDDIAKLNFPKTKVSSDKKIANNSKSTNSVLVSKSTEVVPNNRNLSAPARLQDLINSLSQAHTTAADNRIRKNHKNSLQASINDGLNRLKSTEVVTSVNQATISNKQETKDIISNKSPYLFDKNDQTAVNRNKNSKADANSVSEIEIPQTRADKEREIELQSEDPINSPPNEMATHKQEGISNTNKLQSIIDDLSQEEHSITDKSEGKQKKDVNTVTSLSQNSDAAVIHTQAMDSKKGKSKNPKIKNGGAADLSGLFAKAFGKQAVAGPTKLTVELRVNTTPHGDVKLFSNKAGVIDRVDTADLILQLEDVLKEEVFDRVNKELSPNKKTSFEALANSGIEAFYNTTNLSLDLQIDPELRKPQVLSLLSKKKASVRIENQIAANDISSFLNMYTNLGLDSENDSEPELKMKLEGSVNVQGKTFETTVDYRNEQIDFSKTTLTYDRPEKLQRFTLGNVSTGNRNFQENLQLDGIRISKEFYLDPELQIRPKANESFVLDSDSEVEVFINNQLMQRFYLKEGVYSLEDIGLYDGANNIQVRIKDEFGKITVKTSQQYFDSHLLKKGLSLYAISVGYLSNKQANANQQLIKKPIISGYYQKGISKDLTLSLDAQLSSNSYLLGAETITSMSLGSIKNSFALSGGSSQEGSGVATKFEFKPNRHLEQISLDTLRQDMLGLDTSMKNFINSWTLSGEYRSEDFSLLNGGELNDTNEDNPLDITTNNKKLKANLQSNFSLNLSEDWRGNLNLGVSDYYEFDESYYANLSATRRFNNGVRLSLGARYDTDDDFSMNLQLSVPLSRKKHKRKKDFNLLVNSKDNSLESRLSIKPTSIVGKNSLGGSLEHYQDDSSNQQNLDIQYRNTNFETKLSARNRLTKTNDQKSQELIIGFNSSLACVGTECSTSYPIDDSFALVSGPSNQTNPIAINNGNDRFRYSDDNDTGLPDNYTSLIPAKNKLAVVPLESYRRQSINIAESTLPSGYDTEKTEFEVFPQYHQGFLIKAGGEPTAIIDGILVDIKKKPLAYKGGQWVPVDKEGKAIAFFSNKAGRFRVTSIPAGKYKLELFDYPDMQVINITVPDLKGKVHDVGNVVINQP